ncbi:hypothetical protein ACFQZ4_46115 [Catellatospora coxensis]
MPSLAQRNLTRGVRLGLPSGQAVARALGQTPLTDDQLGLPKPGPLRCGTTCYAKPTNSPAASTSVQPVAASSRRSSSASSPPIRRRTCVSTPAGRRSCPRPPQATSRWLT